MGTFYSFSLRETKTLILYKMIVALVFFLHLSTGRGILEVRIFYAKRNLKKPLLLQSWCSSKMAYISQDNT